MPEVLATLQAAVVIDGERTTLRRGDEIPDGLDSDDRERLEGRGSIVSAKELAEQEDSRESFKDLGQAQEFGTSTSSETSSGNELVDWLRDEKPNVGETIDKADNDPELAQAILDAEGVVTEGDPRIGVKEGLEEIIEDGGE